MDETKQIQAQYKKMTETPIPKLITNLSIPTIVSMLVTNIYNMADTYFVGTLGTSASAATGVVFGLMAILQAFGFMFGHGAETILPVSSVTMILVPQKSMHLLPSELLFYLD